jgi:hypothetical protein
MSQKDSSCRLYASSISSKISSFSLSHRSALGSRSTVGGIRGLRGYVDFCQ